MRNEKKWKRNDTGYRFLERNGMERGASEPKNNEIFCKKMNVNFLCLTTNPDKDLNLDE